MSTEMRKCSSCNEIKPVDDFGHYNSHRCRVCLKEYQREWRKRNPEVREREREKNRARSRALVRLANRHRSEFERLQQEELKAELERVARKKERKEKKDLRVNRQKEIEEESYRKRISRNGR